MFARRLVSHGSTVRSWSCQPRQEPPPPPAQRHCIIPIIRARPPPWRRHDARTRPRTAAAPTCVALWLTFPGMIQHENRNTVRRKTNRYILQNRNLYPCIYKRPGCFVVVQILKFPLEKVLLLEDMASNCNLKSSFRLRFAQSDLNCYRVLFTVKA